MKKFHFTLDKMLRYKDSILEEEGELVISKGGKDDMIVE